jgi:hypothetical protein
MRAIIVAASVMCAASPTMPLLDRWPPAFPFADDIAVS